MKQCGMEMLRAKIGSQTKIEVNALTKYSTPHNTYHDLIYYRRLLPGSIILISLHSWAIDMTSNALFIYGEDELIQKSAQCTINKSEQLHVNG